MAATHKRIFGRILQIDATVPIAIRAAVQNVLGQHLDHPNLTGPSALRFFRVKIAACVQLERCKNLRAKQLRAPTILRQGEQRVERVVIALIYPEIRFKRPKGQ